MIKKERTVREKNDAIVQVKYGDQIMHLENVFIGGRCIEEGFSPVGFYGGALDIGEMGISVMNIIRAVIKTTTEENGLSFEQAISFIKECTVEAVTREIAEAEEGDLKRLQDDLHEIVKRFMERQN